MLIAAAASAAVLLLAGCTEPETPAQTAARDGILLRGNAAEPQTLDPQFATGIPEANILLALYEGLVTPEPQTLQPMPGVAERWEVSADKLTYTFHLRPQARWSNGEPLGAEDFAFAYRRALDPALGAQNAQMLYVLKNAAAYHSGALGDFAEVGVRAIDAHTLELTLAEPTPYFLDLLQHMSWYPLYRPLLERHNAVSTRNSRWNRPGELVSNGPFVLEGWNVAEHLSVRKNPHYHSADAVALSGVDFFPIADLGTEERAFRAGQLHVTNGLPLAKARRYLAQGSPELYNEPFLGSYYYVINASRPPLDDPRVRQALSLVIDRESLASHVLGGGQTPAASLVPTGTIGHQSGARIGEADTPTQADIARAQELLAQAGFPQGRGFPPITLLYNTSENHRLVAEAVQRMWLEHLGVNIALINQDWKVYLDSRQNGHYDIARGGWIGDFNDPTTFLDLFQSTSGVNWSGWGNTQYDALLAAAATEQDAAARAALLREAEQLLLEQAPVLPLYFYVSNYLRSPQLKGWHSNLLDLHPYTALSFGAQTPSPEQPHEKTEPLKKTAPLKEAAPHEEAKP